MVSAGHPISSDRFFLCLTGAIFSYSATMIDILLGLSFIKSPSCTNSIFQNDEACTHANIKQQKYFVAFTIYLSTWVSP